MFINSESQFLINDLRDPNGIGVYAFKATICDAMSIVMLMYQLHASEHEQKLLADAIGTLSNYNRLITELSKEK